jgi:hypothetical protein
VKTIFRALTKLFGIWLWIGAILQSVNGESIPDIVAHAKPAIIEVIAFDAQNRPLKTGTGFFITADGVAVTNYHVIRGASSLTAMTNDGAFFAFESVLYAPPGVDLAILKFAAHDAHWLKLGRSDTAAEGQRVLVIGNPNGLQGTVSDGLIAAFREDRSLIQITAPISPGSSGSPVLDETRQVIGVATLMEVDGQNLNFAIPLETVKDAIASAIAQQGEGGAGKQQPAPSPREPVSLSPRAGGSELNEFVREFVTAGNYDDPSVELGFYGESVDYFDDGRVGKAFIAEDIKKYNSRWPARSYSVQGDPTVTVDSARDMAKAVVVLRFSVQNNRKSIRGSCQKTIMIRDVSTNPKVISVASKMLSRTEEPTRQ